MDTHSTSPKKNEGVGQTGCEQCIRLESINKDLYEACKSAHRELLHAGWGDGLDQLKRVIAKAGVKEVKMPEPKWGHKGEPCSYNEDISCQEDTCLNCSTFEKYIKSIP